MFQLWCFYDIDLKKEWLETIRFELKGNKLKTIVSEYSRTCGTINKPLGEWTKVAENDKEVKVRIFSIKPFIGNQDKKIILDDEAYQFSGDSLKKVIPVVFTNV